MTDEDLTDEIRELALMIERDIVSNKELLNRVNPDPKYRENQQASEEVKELFSA